MADGKQEKILVVGAGPVGLTAAHRLAAYGCSVRVIDSNPGPTDLSKALVVWQRTLEVLDATLPAEKFLEHQLASALHGVILQTSKELLGKVDLESPEAPLPTGLLIPQSATERTLLDKLAEQRVEVERNTQLLSFEEKEDHIVAQVKAADGSISEFLSPWLIGADGAHSQVRHGLALPFDGKTLERRWLLADITLAHEESPHFMQSFFADDGIVALFPAGGKRWRVIIDAGESPRQGTPSQAEIQGYLDRRTGSKWQIEESFWLSEFVINERIVPHYRVGRAFVAGDAAHVHSPAGGQGMNTGMQDAANLAWKLALVQRGAADASLLDSYNDERHAVGEEVVAETSQMIHMAMVHHPLVKRLREFVIRHASRHRWMAEAMKPKLSEIAINYRKGALAQATGSRRGSLRAGDRLPNLSEAGTPIYHSLRHSGATLLVQADHEGPLPEIFGHGKGAFTLHTLRLQIEGALAQELSLGAQGVALIRPDAYIGVIAKNTKELNAWLQAVGLGD